MEPSACVLFAACAEKAQAIALQRGMEPTGCKLWAIAEGYIPSQSSFSDRTLISHETACILNAGDQAAHVNITIFFADRQPISPYRVTVAPRRTLHLCFNDLKDPAAVPRDTDYSSVFETDDPAARSTYRGTGHWPSLGNVSSAPGRKRHRLGTRLITSE
jgi:hypothetical protein